jgi:hypothetical protein
MKKKRLKEKKKKTNITKFYLKHHLQAHSTPAILNNTMMLTQFSRITYTDKLHKLIQIFSLKM